MNNEVFLDTSCAIALSSEKDKFHKRAIDLAEKLEQMGARLITTRAVQLEIGNSLSKQRYRYAAIQLLDSLGIDPSVEVITLTEALYARAFHLYLGGRDKEWGLVDCISFVVMKERNIAAALTMDEHFR